MSGTRFFASAALFALLLSPASPVPALTIDFEGLAHGEVVNGAFADGVSIDVENFRRSWDLALAFDTGRTRTRARDLQGPFSVGNLTGEDLGNVLLIAQNKFRCEDGFCDLPDDEFLRPAGAVSFDFDDAQKSFGFDVLDLDRFSRKTARLDFYLDGAKVAGIAFAELFCDGGSGPFCDASLVAGNRSANRIQPILSDALGSEFDRVVVTLGGAGAIDNVVTQPLAAVPEPSALWLAGSALGGVIALARKRRQAAQRGATPN